MRDYMKIILNKIKAERDNQKEIIKKSTEANKKVIEDLNSKIKSLELQKINMQDITISYLLNQAANTLPVIKCSKLKENYKDLVLNKLTDIDFYNNPITNIEIVVLVQGIVQTNALKYIQLGFCKIGIEGADILGKGLEANLTIEGLYLGKYRPYWQKEMTPDPPAHNNNNLQLQGTKSICRGLKDNVVIGCIDLGYCNISITAIQDITLLANSLMRLKFLSIQENPELEGKVYEFREDIVVET